MNILVVGASGFVGSQVVTDLLIAGHTVTCCVRNTAYANKLFPDCRVIACDFLRDTASQVWLDRLANIDVVINTVGIFYHPVKEVIWKTHYETPKALFDACVQRKVQLIVQVSALGVDQYPVDYAKSKLAAEQYLTQLPVNSVILRPSFIYGRGSYGGSSLFRGLAGLPGVIPVPGKGIQTFQPIYLPDLSHAIVNLVERMPNEKMILAAVSKDRITLKNILLTMRQWLGLSKAIIVSVPAFILRVGSFFGNIIPNSSLNHSSYKMLMTNNVASEKDTKLFATVIGFEPKSFQQGLFSQPSTVQDRWHARLFTAKYGLQFSLAFLWLFTAFTSAFIYPRDASFALLEQVGVAGFWKPVLLYVASALNAILGFALLFNFQVKKVCLLQVMLIVAYTAIISWALPALWLEPFGPITKNIPILIAIYILFILDDTR